LLAAGGVSDDMIRTQVAAGRLTRVRRGVFVATESLSDDRAERHLMLAHAIQVANPDAVLSHQSAGVVWGLSSPGFASWADAQPALTLPAGTGHRSRENGATVRVRSLNPADLTRDAAGYSVTSLARTAVDLATGSPLPDALVVLDDACRKLCAAMVGSPKRATFADSRLAAASRRLLVDAAGRPLVPLMDAIAKAEPARESPAESLIAGHLYLSGLPMPEFQTPVKTQLGTYYPDLVWPDMMLIVECDGAVKYNDRRDLIAEKSREDALREAGYRVIRVLAKDVMLRPHWVIERIRRALEQ
jgi:very-short-patch-repair endonuclease